MMFYYYVYVYNGLLFIYYKKMFVIGGDGLNVCYEFEVVNFAINILLFVELLSWR